MEPIPQFMKQLVSASLILLSVACNAQPELEDINKINPPNVALAPLHFLASDALMGRSATRPEINIAADYISKEFKSMGLKELAGTSDYFQSFSLKLFKPSETGVFKIDNYEFKVGEKLIQISGADIDIASPIIDMGYALNGNTPNLDLKGKIVICNWGKNKNTNDEDAFALLTSQQRLAQEQGATALIVRAPKNIPWAYLQNFMNQEHLQELGTENCNTFFINDDMNRLAKIEPNHMASLHLKGNTIKEIPMKNVMAWVEGTDAKLKNQFVALSAHYDHLGVAAKPENENGKIDSIFNGARDNAIGVAAVIDAARYFAKHPPKRSILFIAFTAEEMGLLGSKYFVANPTIPLRQIVYNLNIDNASYNDTTIISFVGLGRTSADADVKRACASYHLSVLPDPTEEQVLFDASDNQPFAEKGIPSPTFSLGMRSFDASIFKKYHQVSDEVADFDLNYAMKFINAYTLTAKYIADNEQQPKWTPGDKYEDAWKQLYR